jgi:translation elongation factor EF-G
VSEIRKDVQVALVGTPGAGVRTLIGAMTGTLEPSPAGERLWEDSRIQLRAMRVDEVALDDLDLLVVVVSAQQGVSTELSAVWQEASERHLPALIAVTHLDDSTVDIEEITAMCQRVMVDGGEIFLPWLPIHDDDERVCGFINLLSEEIVEWSDGGPVIHASESRHQELIEDARTELCESVMLAVDDDQLFAQYMDGIPVEGEVIEIHMIEQISRGLRHPVLGTGTSPHLLGVGLLLDVIADIDNQLHS